MLYNNMLNIYAIICLGASSLDISFFVYTNKVVNSSSRCSCVVCLNDNNLNYGDQQTTWGSFNIMGECTKPLFGEVCFRNASGLDTYYCGCTSLEKNELHCLEGDVADVGKCVCFMFWGLEHDPDTGECSAPTTASMAFCGVAAGFTFMDIVHLQLRCVRYLQ